MATFTDIKEVRLRIDDPSGFIEIIEVATTGDLPAAPKSQTAYKVTADGNYYSTDTSSGAVLADYTVQELQVSDSRLSAYIDAADVNSATCMAIKQIIANIGRQIGLIKRNTAGADTTEYTSLKELYDYYKVLLAMYTENKREENNNSTGRYYSAPDPTISGGNI